MTIKQISVFIENRKGSLAAFCTLLGENDIDLIALSVADTTDFGILRAIVDDNEKTLKLIKDHGYTATITEVLAVAVADSPGGLAKALSLLDEGGIALEYIYSFVRRIDHDAIIIFRVDKLDEAARLLAGAGVRMLSQAEVAASARKNGK